MRWIFFIVAIIGMFIIVALLDDINEKKTGKQR